MIASDLLLKRKRSPNKAEGQARKVKNGRDRRSPRTQDRAISESVKGAPRWKRSRLPDFPMESLDGFLDLEELDGVAASDFSSVLSQNERPKQEPFLASGDSTEKASPELHEFNGFDDEIQAASHQTRSESRVARRDKSPRKLMEADGKLVGRSYSSLSECTNSTGSSAWHGLGLRDGIIDGLSKLEFVTPTRIQALAIPAILNGYDIVGKASTGSGKTLAFGLPILEYIASTPVSQRATSALILAPTRELAQQISQHLLAVGAYTGASVVTITGGLAMEKQIRILKHVPDIVVATPGRLWDLLSSQEGFLSQLRSIQFLVLDEADRLLQKGHFSELTKIVEAIDNDGDRQTLVFSATFDNDLQRKLVAGKHISTGTPAQDETSIQYLLQKLKLRTSPTFLDANPKTQVVESVRQCLIETSPMDKDFYLYYLLLRHPARTLIFTNSISDVHRLVHLLSLLGIAASGLHSNKQQKARLKAIERFKADNSAVLVASDVAARGLDIPLVDTVIHYHLPRTADLYVHRSGRTARAAAGGLSMLICSSNEKPALKKLQAALRITSMGEFPVSAEQVGLIRPRVNIARQIQKLEDGVSRKSGSRDAWLADAAADLGVELEDSGQKEDIVREKFLIKNLRNQLSQMLRIPFYEGFSGKYLTKGGAQLAQRLLTGKTHEAFVGGKMEKLSERYDLKNQQLRNTSTESTC